MYKVNKMKSYKTVLKKKKKKKKKMKPVARKY